MALFRSASGSGGGGNIDMESGTKAGDGNNLTLTVSRPIKTIILKDSNYIYAWSDYDPTYLFWMNTSHVTSSGAVGGNNMRIQGFSSDRKQVTLWSTLQMDYNIYY